MLKRETHPTDQIDLTKHYITDSFGFQLARILQFKRALFDIEMKQFELSRTQWRVLFWMNILCPCTQKELLKNLDIDAAYLARTLETLENRGYIVRKPFKEDRRCLLIEMTDQAKVEILPHMQEAVKKEQEILLQGLDEKEQEQLMRMLKQLAQNMMSALGDNNDDKEGNKK